MRPRRGQGTVPRGKSKPSSTVRDVEREIDDACAELISKGGNRAAVEQARQDTLALGGDVFCFREFRQFWAALHSVTHGEQEPPARRGVELLQRILPLMGVGSDAASRGRALWEIHLRLERLEGPNENDLKLSDGGSMRAHSRDLRDQRRKLERFAKREAPTASLRAAIAMEVSIARIQCAVVEGTIAEVDAEPALVGEDAGNPQRRTGPQPATQRRHRWLIPLARRLVDAGATSADIARLVVDADLHWVKDPCVSTAAPYRGSGSEADRQGGVEKFAQLLRKDMERIPKRKARRKMPRL